MKTQYRLIADASRFTVQTFSRGMLNSFAHNPVLAINDFAGTLAFDPDDPTATAFSLVAKTASLEVVDQAIPADRPEIERIMHQQLLESAFNPEIVFQSTSATGSKAMENWYNVRIVGDLTILGVTKSETVEGQLRILEDRVRLSGRHELPQSRYFNKQISAGAGLIKLKDELKFTFDLVAKRADPK